MKTLPIDLNNNYPIVVWLERQETFCGYCGQKVSLFPPFLVSTHVLREHRDMLSAPSLRTFEYSVAMWESADPIHRGQIIIDYFYQIIRDRPDLYRSALHAGIVPQVSQKR